MNFWFLVVDSVDLCVSLRDVDCMVSWEDVVCVDVVSVEVFLCLVCLEDGVGVIVL